VSNPRELLAKAGLRPRKRYGQNFLIDAAAARRIAECALEGAPARSPVLEIGAGTGALTVALLARGAELTAIEIDSALVGLLRSRADLAAARIVEADALTFDYGAWSQNGRWRAVGNLPYNIATPLILRLIEMERGPESLTVMVQKDVAQRLGAAPATAAYGSLSVAVQFAMHVETEFTLRPRAFYPPPKVDSSVVRLVRRAAPAVRVGNLALFWKVVRGAFAYRRKTLPNTLALALGLERAQIVRALELCNLSPELRGERLALGDFARLADALAEG
jgi:16S rRNA (adenine1518-N6/adenine1519-N6)-dimethyltransferase